ncbi:MAG: hypothetical protein ACLR2E_16730 [Lachnospiraceae bacterium]
MSFIERELQKTGPAPGIYQCGYRGQLARFCCRTFTNAKLDTVAKALNVSLENHHRAVDDAGL